MPQPWFQRGYRRMLVDMHIPDWDERFLSKYDPAEMVRLYQLAGLTSVMYYAQSHVGLCYWPTKIGKMHAGLQGRDIVGETLELLRRAKIDACIYTSVIYNNWAYLEHPDWRLVPATKPRPGEHNGGRYGRCCPNHPEYRQFTLALTEELVGRYRFDGIFFDMTFWPRVCLCEHCRRRFRDETGQAIPETVDWLSPDWCRCQQARQQWMIDFATTLNERAKATSPDITTYHNFASAKSNWVPGVSLEIAKANDLIGADFYGDPVEQLMVCKLMTSLTDHPPAEFMTSRCLNLVEHESNKSPALIRTQALAAALFSSAMLFIDAIHPDGTVNPGPYRMIREVYDEMSRYEPYLGGTPVEDVAVYFSDASKMDFAENGRPLSEAGLWQRDYPHLTAARGACRALQEAHLPFGVISRKQLPTLDRYRVVVLPNVLRMDREEAEAFRRYVHGGGRLYASRYTSLTETCGARGDDFLLADVFGCHFGGDDLGRVAYVKPAVPALRRALGAQQYLGHMAMPGTPTETAGTLRLADRAEGHILATLTLPYDKEWGTVYERNWSSIHSSPPWRDTATPAIVEHRFGKGRAIYSAADIERTHAAADAQLFTALIGRLVGGRTGAGADAPPCVWMSVTDQPDRMRMIVGLLNYPPQLPAVPIAEVPITVRPPKGKRFVRLKSVPEGRAVRFTCAKDGTLRATVKNLEAMRMLAAEYR